MLSFGNISIQRKLTLIITLTSLMALALAGAVLGIYLQNHTRVAQIQDLIVQARLIGQSSTGALMNDDPTAVKLLLDSLKVDRSILAARIYDQMGRPFASYVRGDLHPFQFPDSPQANAKWFDNGVAVTVAIEFQERSKGTMYLKCERRQLTSEFWRVLALLLGVLTLLVAFVAHRVQRLVSQPVLNLARIANEVAANQNYSLRAVKESDDDLGHLVGSFNWMLTLIQAREMELQNAREELEHRVNERTSALSQANEMLRKENLERQRAEEALRNSQQKLLLHVRQTPLGVIDWNLEFQAINWNPAAEKIFGWTEGDAIGQHACDLVFPPSARQAVSQMWEALLSGRGGKQVVYENRTKTGQAIICEWFNTPLITIDGRVVGVSSLVLDATLRQKAEEALRRSEELFSKAFRSSPQAISISTLLGGQFLDVNDSFLTLLGYQREEIIGRTAQELELWDNPNDRASLLKRLHDHRRFRDVPCHFRAKDGRIRNTLLSAELIDLGREPCTLFIYHDITDRVSLEEQLRQSQKMEAIGRLAAGVAHDFNNILTIIQGHTALMIKKFPTEPRLNESLKQIGGAAERAANLVRQLLAFSRRQVMQPKTLDLNETVRNMARMLNRMLGEDIVLEFNCDGTLPPIMADVGMIEQVILNLVVNARDAMPVGGRVLIGTSMLSLDEAAARQRTDARAGQFVRLTVGDTGSGIDPAIIGRIFEPFFTTKEVGKGTGLGLSMVYGIVKQHEGWIEVDSKINEGTTFVIYLPANAVYEPAVAEPPGVADDVCGGSETILVVEDEAALRELVRNVLEFLGYIVITASNGVEGLRAWEEKAGKVDLLVTDMVMPEGISGRVLAERLLAKKPGLKVIYSSGYSIDLFSKDFTVTDGFNFLAKPYHPAALARAVRDCLDGKPITTDPPAPPKAPPA
jgi:PAS domain S-box-containing protein